MSGAGASTLGAPPCLDRDTEESPGTHKFYRMLEMWFWLLFYAPSQVVRPVLFWNDGHVRKHRAAT